MRSLAFLSRRGSSARTFLAANLAHLLDAPVRLLEFGTSASSDLSLYLGLTPMPFDQDSLALPGSGPLLFFLPPNSPAPNFKLPPGDGWLLVDGLTLEDPCWEDWLEWCGQGLISERGDLVGGRRAAQSLDILDGRHFSRKGLCLAWSPSFDSQPMPHFEGLDCLLLPEFPRAAERLAESMVPAKADPGSPFSRAARTLALKLGQMGSLGARAGNDHETQADLRITSAPIEEKERELLQRCLEGVRHELNLRKIGADEVASPQFREKWTPKVRQVAASYLAKETTDWLTRERRARLTEDLISLVLGLGPLENLLRDPGVSEIMVNGHDQIFIERAGKLSLSPASFWNDTQLLQVIERIVAPLGRRIDESSPRVDARLPDGSRVNAVIPPLALRGPCLTIRKFSNKRLSMAEWVALGSLSSAAASFLRNAVLHRKNIVISGGTGSGKTTLLNALSSFIPEDERIITIEDSAELKLDQSHVVSLEARSANLEGRGAVSVRDLVANCLRMRPDRIVVGECRGGEALDMLQAMNTGHDGSLTTVHANSARDALARIETLCLMSDISLPLSAIRRQMASAVQLIVQVARMKDGIRRVVSVSEISGMEGDVISSQDLFVFKQEGEDASGRIVGKLKASGIAAGFYRTAKAEGHALDFSVFAPE